MALIIKENIIANCGYLPNNWTIDSLYEPHNSVPYNPCIARTFYRTGMIESWGRGIEKIVSECVQEKVPVPKYTAFPGDINMTFFYTSEYVRWSENLDQPIVPETRQETGVETGVENDTNSGANSAKIFGTLTNAQQQIILVIQENGSITQRKIAEKTGLALSTVISNIDQLKKMNILSRTGTHQKGTWNILLDNKGE